MVLCSIEEAWGSDFNKSPNSTPGYSKTYVKEKQNPSRNRYKYDFSRDSAPLSEHNGSYRSQVYNRVNIPNHNNNNDNHELLIPETDNDAKDPRFSQQNININQQNLIDKYNYNQEENNIPQVNIQKNKNIDKFDNNYHNNNNNHNIEYNDNVMPNEETDEYENFETKNYNDNTDDEYELTEENSADIQDDVEHLEDFTETINSEQTGNITVNMSHLLNKVNNLIDYFDQYTKGNGNELKDVFMFVIIGIFFIFIMDLIFRIGQKIKG